MVLRLIPKQNILANSEREKISQWILHEKYEQSTAKQTSETEVWLDKKPERRQEADALDAIWNDDCFTAALKQYETNQQNHQQNSQKSDHKSSTLWYGGIAASVVLTLGILLFRSGDVSEPVYFNTQKLQTAHQLLDDGSRLDISAASQVLVKYSAAERHIDLVEGEAQFNVSKDPTRPFVVETRHATLQALGTVFNVDQRRDSTELTVLEGRVEVAPLQAGNKRVILTAGQRALIRANGHGPVETFDLTSYRDWQHNILEADNMPLADIIAELNRYRNTAIGIHSDIGNLPVSGTFRLDDAEKNLQLITSAYQLTISEKNGMIFISR
ncbi:FecR family protein [Thalassolituus sp. UBA2009]|uniref:FecR family protein n=1 Tax=Thalassolituus sp. UBA2009 TaxID=1947658 RepID=UPI00257A7C54|nr:FecR domain-containing protein [Thalassolituus sp. UBA2009]